MAIDPKMLEEAKRQAAADNAKEAAKIKKAQEWAKSPEAQKIFGDGEKKPNKVNR